MAKTHLKKQVFICFPPTSYDCSCVPMKFSAYSFLGGTQEDKITDTTACGEEGWILPTQADLLALALRPPIWVQPWVVPWSRCSLAFAAHHPFHEASPHGTAGFMAGAEDEDSVPKLVNRQEMAVSEASNNTAFLSVHLTCHSKGCLLCHDKENLATHHF